MNTPLEAAIRENTFRYLVGELTLTEFEDWFVPATWNQIGRTAPWVEALIGELELRLAEYTNGHRAADEVREYFARAISFQTVGVAPYTSSTEGTFTMVSQSLRVEPAAIAAPALLSAAGSW